MRERTKEVDVAHYNLLMTQKTKHMVNAQLSLTVDQGGSHIGPQTWGCWGSLQSEILTPESVSDGSVACELGKSDFWGTMGRVIIVPLNVNFLPSNPPSTAKNLHFVLTEMLIHWHDHSKIQTVSRKLFLFHTASLSAFSPICHIFVKNHQKSCINRTKLQDVDS